MYSDRTAITNPELLYWAEKLAALESEPIKALIDLPALPCPEEARAALQSHLWATAARCICMRAPEDNPEKWRNALPPDRTPIVLNFNEAVMETADGKVISSVTDTGFKVWTDTAKEYIHDNDYKYIGTDDEGRHQFINTVARTHKDNPDDTTVGHELVVLLGKGKAVSLYLGNDGLNKDLPKEFREVRLLTDLSPCYEKVIDDLTAAAHALDENSSKFTADYVKLQAHILNYHGHLAARLNAGLG